VSARAARVLAQAKINLGLRVLARDTDGYHAIETVFARLALGDEVTVRITDGPRSLDCRGAEVGPVEKNLAWRAALAMHDAVGWPRGFAITIEKRIPVGGGLGGGSADAGAVLRALNALAPHPVDEEQLLRLAASLGADVPFLTSGASLALAWSRGERMLRLPPLPERYVALVQPGFSVPTADAYRWLDAARGPFEPTPALTGVERLASWESLAALTANDFEPVIAARHPGIEGIADALRRAGASVARMSGSGSSVYGIFVLAPERSALTAALPGHLIITRTALGAAPVELIDARA
jgi:4-diphosphocytidyl-2-C-methyl-D-erythritol kinase